MEQNIIQFNIETWQFVLGLLTFAFGIGLSWGSMRDGIKNLKKDFKEFKEDFKTLNPALNKFANAIAEIQRLLRREFKDFVPLHEMEPDSILQEKSPLSLTEIGRALLEESSAETIVDRYYDELAQKIDAEQPKSALDIQEACTVVIANIQDENYMNPVKDFIYQHPRFKEKIKLEYVDALRAMAIYLRDKYLERHPEFFPQAVLN